MEVEEDISGSFINRGTIRPFMMAWSLISKFGIESIPNGRYGISQSFE